MAEAADLHSLVQKDGVWELRVYQSPSVLLVNASDKDLLAVLQQALRQDRQVLLDWEPHTARVLSARLE